VPSRNIVKTYLENGYYHVYNRGVEKRVIFLDEQDCKVFLHYLKLYLSPIEDLKKMQIVEPRLTRFIVLNLSREVDLLSFALMPNHFHLQVKQYTKDGLTKLMRRLTTSYVMYFNKKYKRVGTLFQNAYKACLIDEDEYLLHVSRYIHRNSFDITTDINFLTYSSYFYYLGLQHANWIKPQEILSYFSNKKDILGHTSYKDFVEMNDSPSEEVLGELTLEVEED